MSSNNANNGQGSSGQSNKQSTPQNGHTSSSTGSQEKTNQNQIPAQLRGPPQQTNGGQPIATNAWRPQNQYRPPGPNQQYYVVQQQPQYRYQPPPVQFVYQTLPDGTVVIPQVFDTHARFDEIAQPIIPPPPPGVTPNAAQQAIMDGKKLMVGKRMASSWMDAGNE